MSIYEEAAILQYGEKLVTLIKMFLHRDTVTLKDNVAPAHNRLVHIVCQLIKQSAKVCINVSVSILSARRLLTGNRKLKFMQNATRCMIYLHTACVHQWQTCNTQFSVPDMYTQLSGHLPLCQCSLPYVLGNNLLKFSTTKILYQMVFAVQGCI